MNTTIPSLPPPLQEVPHEKEQWLDWRYRVLAWRSYVHEQCQSDPSLAALHYDLAAADPEYFRVMFCPIYEPRATIDYEWDEDAEQWVEFEKPSGWYPWVPFHFQVDLGRWINRVTTLSRLDPDGRLGRGDGVVEKSREMGASWEFCKEAAHDFLFQDNTDIGFVSYKEEVVDNGDDPKSLFYKLRALIGVYPKVPIRSYAPDTMWHDLPVRIPDWMAPAGWSYRDHNRVNHIAHPTKNNNLRGNSTSGRTGTGDRWSWGMIDEGAKNDNVPDIWGNLQAVTLHRLILSSADLTYGDGFFNLARSAEKAVREGTPGPSFYQIPWTLHPLRDDGWLEAERNRSNLDPAQFAREYEMNYLAGFGDWVYPYAQQIQPGPFPYVPGMGPVYASIDPSIADPNAILIFQNIMGTGRTRLVDALVINVQTAEELTPILMGFPPGHEEYESCPFGARDFMAFLWRLRERGENVTWVGDPYGNSNSAAGTGTFYEAVLRRSQELSTQYPELPHNSITIYFDYDDTARYHPGRKEALTALLPNLDVNDVPGARHVLEALQRNHYKPADGITTERLKPEHDWTSHPTTSAEFFAVHNRVTGDVQRMRRQRMSPGPHLPRTHTPRRAQKPRLQSAFR